MSVVVCDGSCDRRNSDCQLRTAALAHERIAELRGERDAALSALCALVEEVNRGHASVNGALGAAMKLLGMPMPARDDSTIFECQFCGAFVGGKTDGSFDKPGWMRILHIDGPNAICPECAAKPDEALSALREDYPNASVVEKD